MTLKGQLHFRLRLQSHLLPGATTEGNTANIGQLLLMSSKPPCRLPPPMLQQQRSVKRSRGLYRKTCSVPFLQFLADKSPCLYKQPKVLALKPLFWIVYFYLERQLWQASPINKTQKSCCSGIYNESKRPTLIPIHKQLNRPAHLIQM